MFKIRFHFRFCPFLIHKNVPRQPNVSNILANPFFSCNDEMRRMDFATGTEKKKSLWLKPRGLFLLLLLFFLCVLVLFHLFDKRTDRCVTYTAQHSISLERNINFAWTNHLHAELLCTVISALKHKRTCTKSTSFSHANEILCK